MTQTYLPIHRCKTCACFGKEEYTTRCGNCSVPRQDLYQEAKP